MRLFLLTVVLVLTTARANAGIIVYTNKAAFDVAVSTANLTSILDDFEDLTLNPSLGLSTLDSPDQ